MTDVMSVNAWLASSCRKVPKLYYILQKENADHRIATYNFTQQLSFGRFKTNRNIFLKSFLQKCTRIRLASDFYEVSTRLQKQP